MGRADTPSHRKGMWRNLARAAAKPALVQPLLANLCDGEASTDLASLAQPPAQEICWCNAYAADAKSANPAGCSLFCYAMLCYAVLCFALLCYALLCYETLCYALLCYAMLRYVLLCYAMRCYAMLCDAMQCYAMLCYVCYAMLCNAMLCVALLALLGLAWLCLAFALRRRSQKRAPQTYHACVALSVIHKIYRGRFASPYIYS